MAIIFHEGSRTFHLYNKEVSYIMTVLENDQMGQLYFGKAIKDREDFNHLLVSRSCVLAPSPFRGNLEFSMEAIKQEYPAYGTGDYRDPAYQLEVPDGSRITDFKYVGHEIYRGKKALEGLPHTHGEEEDVTTLEVIMWDEMIFTTMILKYHIFEKYGAIVRSTEFINRGEETIDIKRAMSTSLDLYDYDYEMLQLDGAWSRERHVSTRELHKGIQSIGSTRGASSPNHNPFLALKRKDCTESNGEVFGFSLIYSGNFLAQAQVDSYDVTRIMMGIHPFDFTWGLDADCSFQTPEAVMVYSSHGLNGMSQTYHELYRNHLMKSIYRNQVRPILINNWEATYFDFDEESILRIASKAKDLGIELFVLDDGWFGKRNNDKTSLGDWFENLEKLPNGIKGLSEKIKALGLDFGLWFEPEMVNEVSELYESHPDWIIHVPGRTRSYGRNQFILDFSRKEVVDHIYEAMIKVIDNAQISYIKWDMNRNITEAYSLGLARDRQQEMMHRYILGVYDLYDRLTKRYPHILFESCASGGGRFDPGMLYYAPQTWTSDDTDAVERLPIQYGTSMVYPIVSMGSHVAAIPNHQVDRKTSMKMRAEVAYFGTFGYELDLNLISDEEKIQVLEQVAFFKQYREIIQFGTFYRMEDGSKNRYSWMVISKDQKTAIVAYYKVLAEANTSLKKVKLQGLNSEFEYVNIDSNQRYFGDELMHVGLLCETEFTGSEGTGSDKGDFTSHVVVLQAI